MSDAFTSSFGDIRISCRKADRYISVQSAEWYNLFECALYCCHFQEKLSLFSQILFSQQVTIEETWCKLISNRDIYIICREAIRRVLNSKTQLEITGEMYQMPPRSCTCALFDSHHARDIVSRKLLRSADIGHQDAMRVCTFYTTLTHETHNNK